MKDFRIKMKLIYLPFFIIALCIIGGYTFINWLFLHNLNLFSLKKMIVEFVLPGMLTVFFVLVWLRPGIKILYLFDKNGDDRYYFIYYTAVIIGIFIPTVIAQDWLENSTGNLVELTNAEQIRENDSAKYYRMDSCFLDKSGVSADYNVSLSDRGDKILMKLYCVIPIYNSPEDSRNKIQPDAWYGIKYNHSVKNNLSEEDKEIEFRNFVSETENQLTRSDLYKFDYLRREGNTYDRDFYEKAVHSNSAFSDKSVPLIILIPESGEFDKRTGNSFMWIFISFFISGGVFFMMVVIPLLNPAELHQYKYKERHELKDAVSAFIIPFKPQKDFFVTPILILINMGIYIIMSVIYQNPFEFTTEALIKWGAQSNYLILEEYNWWRLLSSVFLQTGLMHLAINMVSLYFSGILMEPVLGKKWMIILFLLSGICASLVSVLWNSKESISVGASGAIMGVYGAIGAFLITRFWRKELRTFLIVYLSIFMGANLLAGLSGGVDNAAHVGGFISGFFVGIILRFTLQVTAEDYC